MRDLLGRRMAGQLTLTKPIYPQYFFQTKSDQALKKELAHLKKNLHSRQSPKNHLNYQFYETTSSHCIDQEDEKWPQEVWPNEEVNSSEHAECQWKMEDESSFLQMAENYSSSESSIYPSPEKSF